MSKVKRICKYCGKEFYVKKSIVKAGKGKFCSKKCYNKARTEFNDYKGNNASNWKEKVKHICKYCGKEFEVAPAVDKKGGGKFCCHECYGKYISGENAPNWKGGKVKKICEYCGKEFCVNNGEIEKGWGKFCSKECQYNARSEFDIYHGKNHWHWKEKIKCVCQYCGNEFETHFSIVESGRGKFCCKECYWLSMSGENAPNWQGGISFEPYCPKFNNQKKEEIREKYGRKCFICGKIEEENGRKLDVHHIDYDKSGGCDGRKLELVPLCRSCHSKTNFNRKIWEVLIKHKKVCNYNS